MKTDARTRYTRHIIQDVFLELLKEKPISKITVKEICEKAEINRGTFYKHYADVYELMEKLEASALKEFQKLLSSTDKNGTMPVLVTLLNTLKKHRELIAPLTKNMSNDGFINQLADCCSQYAISHLNNTECDYHINSQKHYQYIYLVGGTSNLIHDWMDSNCTEDAEEIAAAIERFNDAIQTIVISKIT